MATVLLIATQSAALEPLARQLRQRRGLELTWCRSVAQARAELRRHDYDVILTDRSTGDGDGFALLCEAEQRQPQALRVVLGHRHDDTTLFEAIDLARAERILDLGQPAQRLVEEIEALLLARKRRFVALSQCMARNTALGF